MRACNQAIAKLHCAAPTVSLEGRRPDRAAAGSAASGVTRFLRFKRGRTMERRKFGNTSLEVSAISLGCWPFGVDWWGHYTDEQGVRLCQFAFDQGITFFDNGDAYGNGRAE